MLGAGFLWHGRGGVVGLGLGGLAEQAGDQGRLLAASFGEAVYAADARQSSTSPSGKAISSGPCGSRGRPPSAARSRSPGTRIPDT